MRCWDGRVIMEMEMGTRIVVRWYGWARAVGWHDKLAERRGRSYQTYLNECLIESAGAVVNGYS